MPEPVVLVINCGSSSLKFAAIEPMRGGVRIHGIAERLGTDEASLGIASSSRKLGRDAGPAQILDHIAPSLDGLNVAAVGHRVVHGGEAFAESVVLDERAIERIAECVQLAPLHNPANLAGIAAARARFRTLPHVAVFDTAFHQSLPPKAYVYAVPYELYERHQVRRYGFHGTSHQYVAAEAARRIGKPLAELGFVTAHLGNGCSTCAVQGGRSLDTSMGFTPLEGLVMGTRSGDVDPNLHAFLAERTGQSLTELTEMLNRKSGLLGLSGLSNDMRTLLEAAARNERAALAVEVFCYRLAKSILGLGAALESLDALIFTGGIGEHAAAVREKTLAQLKILGARVDPEANAVHGGMTEGRITTPASGLLALVVPTNEELVIARLAELG
jgi:acetate kinase